MFIYIYIICVDLYIYICIYLESTAGLKNFAQVLPGTPALSSNLMAAQVWMGGGNMCKTCIFGADHLMPFPVPIGPNSTHPHQPGPLFANSASSMLEVQLPSDGKGAQKLESQVRDMKCQNFRAQKVMWKSWVIIWKSPPCTCAMTYHLSHLHHMPSHWLPDATQ